ncbi:acyl-CoA dehydrogenase family protein [Falsirhodobacter xinxiangensis]|uniref:acyl-CoA dehydrogenase family protein n=1 Tax=Falsirhodobacter xinxiangensis TaxID=2530049 RepID=UPI00145BF20B|nr:acyl-CoA dehydrogenase family protein [Rhodobacter xinxiangensis]
MIRGAAELVAAAAPESGLALADALRAGGLLPECATLAHHAQDPARLMRALVAIGRANMSAGRIFEGHVNAVKLLHLFGAPLDDVRAGLLFGIWGADGPDPARIEGDRLRGAKLFASGADVLDRMIVTVRLDNQPQLLLLRRDQLEGRLFPKEWDVSGMKATASGRCNLEGLSLSEAVPLGTPGDYLTEPHFQGGVWRYAAVQLGAMQALTAITAAQLAKRGQQNAPLQSLRLRRMVTACETARLWLLQAARAVERPAATPADAEAAILARLVTADEATALMAAMDQALGAASFATAHPADRIRRDLTFYIRQANPDALGQSAMDRILSNSARMERWIP